MAENESLDVGNRRFKWIVADLLRGAPAAEISERLLKKLCGAWNYVRRHGFDVANVVGIAAVGGDLAPAVQHTGGSDLAHLIKLHAQPMTLPAAVLDDANRAAVEQVVDSGLQNAICHVDGLSIDQASRIKREIMSIAECAVSSITDSLLGGSRVRVRVPTQRPAQVPIPAVTIPYPAGLMAQSLLTSAQRERHGGSYESNR